VVRPTLRERVGTGNARRRDGPKSTKFGKGPQIAPYDARDLHTVSQGLHANGFLCRPTSCFWGFRSKLRKM